MLHLAHHLLCNAPVKFYWAFKGTKERIEPICRGSLQQYMYSNVTFSVNRQHKIITFVSEILPVSSQVSPKFHCDPLSYLFSYVFSYLL